MRAAPAIIATAVLAVTAAGVGVAVASDGDDVRQVGAVDVGAVPLEQGVVAASADPTTEPTGGTGATDDATTGASSDTRTGEASTTGSSTTGSSTTGSSTTGSDDGAQQVQGLDRVQGVLTRDEDDDDSDADDADDFEVAGVDLELGPDSWLTTAGSLADFDQDGTLRPVLQELDGLVGQDVTVLGRLDGDGDDLEVYEIQGLTFRDSAGGPAPWQSGDPAAAVTQDQAVQAALAAVGEGSRLDGIDREDDGGATWEVEVEDAQGREQRVLLDVAGAVLDIRLED